mgnify:CR=1 FL=1
MAVYLYNSMKRNSSNIPKWLVELLKKDEPIKLDSEYVNDYYNITDATEDNINNWKGSKVFSELKKDMEDWCTAISHKIEQLPGVENCRIKGSDSAGMSTYINVNFKRPSDKDADVRSRLKDDPKFLTHYFSGFGKGGGYEGEYRLKFRVSNHKPKFTDANVYVNILNHNYSWIESKILELCKKRITQLDSYWKDYLRTGQISPKQQKRNASRKDGDVIVLEVLNPKHIYIIKESFGTDRLDIMLDDNTLKYLDASHTDLEDVLSEVESYFSNVEYIKLLNVMAKCLNKFVIEYTFEDDYFNTELLIDDMKKELTHNLF